MSYFGLVAYPYLTTIITLSSDFTTSLCCFCQQYIQNTKNLISDFNFIIIAAKENCDKIPKHLFASYVFT